ncbi:MAG: dienelactone hydrolase family protein [Gammaproteobacteria bacterium]
MPASITLQAADGHRLSAHVAEPAGTPRGGLVVVQEIFGVNDHVRRVVEGYAADGYLTVAPALFDRVEPGVELGYDDAGVQRGRALKAASDAQRALLDLAAAVAHAARAGRVGMVGYCWGGLLTWLAAANVDGLAAAVPYYGGGIPDHAAIAPRCPVLAHFGARDALIPLAGVEALRRAQPGVDVQVYDAGHGFNCEQRASFDAAAAALARERTLAFLRRHVG